MKHLFTLIAFFAVSLCGFAEHVYDYSALEINNHRVYYKLNNETLEATVTNDGNYYYTSDETHVYGYFGNMVIPATIEVDKEGFIGTYKVTAIEKEAFENRKTLKSITIPNTVTSIGYEAFSGCDELEDVNFAEGSSLKTIGEGAFQYCIGLQNFALPNSVTNIEKYAFFQCSNLESFDIPSGSKLEAIDERAFDRCEQLSSFYIPNTVTSIGKAAFWSCKALSSVEFEEGSTLQIIHESTFQSCKALTKINIPNSVKSIGELCFARSGLELFLPTTFSSLEEIGPSAFRGCESLQTVSIPRTVNWIGRRAFVECTNLKNVICYALVPPVLEDKGNGDLEDYLFFSTIGASISLKVPIPALYEAAAKVDNRWQGLNITRTESIQLIDGEVYPYKNGNPITYNSMAGMYPQYVRTFSASNANKWNAIYVPFSIKASEDYDIAEIYNVCPTEDTNGDGVVDDKDELKLVVRRISDNTVPNKPYFIRPKEARTYTIPLVGGTLYAAPEVDGSVSCSTTQSTYTITGTYTGVEATANDGKYYMASDGTISHRENGSTTIKPNRWVMTITPKSDYNTPSEPANANVKMSVFVIGEDEGDATAIANILNNKNANNDTYAIDGRKVSNENLMPGIYVRNGKKIFVK